MPMLISLSFLPSAQPLPLSTRLVTVCGCAKTQEILLTKAEGERLGMHIKGGLNGQRGNPADPSDEGVFVSKINSVGAARRDGRLKVSAGGVQTLVGGEIQLNLSEPKLS